MHIVQRAYDHPDVTALVERLQAEYTRIYGGPDESPADAGQFSPPNGGFCVGYEGGTAVAMGGWRRRDGGRAELKRMYVPDEHRGNGHSRAILTWLENAAAADGAVEMVLETNQRHPAALALYRSAGYAEVEPFGYYADDPLTVYLGVPLPRRA
ncbi:Acetyltransferase (GNAT) family protein [Saccharopolyspora kobensis]|uniref:Acetyltransferase (GNAT) family protein n=1 Tax=Saccharopolyspora kobensis TaxID=146035 RepID=A0A1H6DEX1_9PSEU|nr:GNAT family N-acetyltransferase [Saccharopolyspora kobensis]SEG83116.1 Acetyltransferase (GNAT) family protein [Saccharopolyspora kobensis]SFE28572.1 Acetyltransferase (GNAT) family protein [Saccharopolyspora kobensis]